MPVTPAYRSKARESVFLILAALVAMVGWATFWAARGAACDLPRWALWIAFSLLIKGPAGRAVPQEEHSLVGIVDVAALMLFGPVEGALVVGGAALFYQLERGLLETLQARRAGRPISWRSWLAYPLFDSGLKVAMALAAGNLYLALGGSLRPAAIEAGLLGPALALYLAWFALDHLGWAVAEAVLGGWPAVGEWASSILGPSLLLELLPLPLSLLLVSAYRQDPTLGEALSFALVAAGLIGTSWVIQRLFALVQEQRRAARELATLNEAVTAIVQAELNVEGLCELIYEQARRLVDATNFHLGLIENDQLTLQIRVVDGIRRDKLTVSLPPGEGIVGWMRQSKQPLLVRDFARESERLPARPRYISPTPPRSAVFVPLISRGEVIGSLSIQSMRPAAFSEAHLRLLLLIANQAAVAIEKARLYQASQERAAQLERMVRENEALYAQVREERDRLELLYDISRDLTRRLDLDDLLERLLYRTVELLHAEDGTILLLGSQRESPRAISAGGAVPSDAAAVLERGLAGWVLRERQGALVPNVHDDPRWLSIDREVTSAIAVPILLGNMSWGAITLTHSQPGFFGQADLSLLTALAEQAAVALDAARLYDIQRRRAVQLQTISQIMRNILSILDLDRLLSEVVQLLRERFDYAQAHVFTLDPAGDEVIFRASTDPENPFWKSRGGRASIEEGLVGWVARHGEVAIVGDVRQDPRWLPDQTDVHSEVAVPLKVAGQVVGVLDVQSAETGAFNAEDAFILRTLADQIAVALETARLYAMQQEEAWVLNALLQIAQNIAEARDLDELLEVVVRLVPLLVGVEHCVLFARERHGDRFLAVHGYGVQRERLPAMSLAPGELPAFDRAAQEAVPVFISDQQERGTVGSSLWEMMGAGLIWLFPLLVGGEVSGMLALGLEKPQVALTPRQRTILDGLTRQAGIAIEEARLRGEAIQRQRLEQELAVAREIQRSLLPAAGPELPGWSIDVAWESARQVGGDFYDFIRLPGNRLGIVIADVSDKGVPAALFMVLSRSLIRASALSHDSPAAALQRANRLIQEDSTTDMFVTAFYGVIDLQSGEMRYASGGHNPPFLCRASDGAILSLEARGIILGVVEEAQWEECTVQLAPGDTLVLYTDGVTEAINSAEEQFGEERLRRTICRHRHADLGAARRALLAALEEFSEGQPPFDDITLVLVRREAPVAP